MAYYITSEINPTRVLSAAAGGERLCVYLLIKFLQSQDIPSSTSITCILYSSCTWTIPSPRYLLVVDFSESHRLHVPYTDSAPRLCCRPNRLGHTTLQWKGRFPLSMSHGPSVINYLSNPLDQNWNLARKKYLTASRARLSNYPARHCSRLSFIHTRHKISIVTSRVQSDN